MTCEGGQVVSALPSVTRMLGRVPGAVEPRPLEKALETESERAASCIHKGNCWASAAVTTKSTMDPHGSYPFSKITKFTTT